MSAFLQRDPRTLARALDARLCGVVNGAGISTAATDRRAVIYRRAGPLSHPGLAPAHIPASSHWIDESEASHRRPRPCREVRPDHVAAGATPRPAPRPRCVLYADSGGLLQPVQALASPAGELLRATLICLPLEGLEVALGYDRLLGAQGPMPEAGNPLS